GARSPRARPPRNPRACEPRPPSLAVPEAASGYPGAGVALLASRLSSPVGQTRAPRGRRPTTTRAGRFSSEGTPALSRASRRRHDTPERAEHRPRADECREPYGRQKRHAWQTEHETHEGIEKGR